MVSCSTRMLIARGQTSFLHSPSKVIKKNEKKKKSKVIKKKLLELNESVKYSTVRVVARPL
jgi:hypothetical protein